MLGPLICHTIRPLVFRAGLWTIELEKSWNHLFEMVATLMKRGYPLNAGGNSCTCPPDVNNLSSASSGQTWTNPLTFKFLADRDI